MLFKRFADITAGKVEPPFERTLKMVFSPQADGVEGFTFLMVELCPGSENGLHQHAESGELMYFVTGRGKGTLGEGTFDVEPDTAMYAPPGVLHRVVNTSDEPMKIACVFVPAAPEDYVRLAMLASRAEGEGLTQAE